MPSNVDVFFRIPVSHLLKDAREGRVYKAIPVIPKDHHVVSWTESGLTVPNAAFDPSSGPASLDETTATTRSLIMKFLGFKVSLLQRTVVSTRNVAPSEIAIPSFPATIEWSSLEDEWARQILFAGAALVSSLDKLLITGNSSVNANEFDGLATLLNSSTAFYYDDSANTFDINRFDDWLTRLGSATHILCHPIAAARIYIAALSMGGISPTIVLTDTANVKPGIGMTLTIRTAVGDLEIVPDVHFPYTLTGTDFVTNLYVLNMSSNGRPLVYQAVLRNYEDPDSDSFLLAPLNVNPLYKEAFMYTQRVLVVENPGQQGVFKAKFSNVPSAAMSYQPIA